MSIARCCYLLVCCSLLSGADLKFFRNYFLKGDYAVAGVGLRAKGANGQAVASIDTTTLAIPPDAEVVAAWLYWESIIDPSTKNLNGESGTFAGMPINGIPVGTAPAPRSSKDSVIVTYRADVWAAMPRDSAGIRRASGVFQVILPDSGSFTSSPSTEGASVVIVYRSPNAPFRSVVLYEGAVTVQQAGDTFSLDVQGFYQTAFVSPQAKITYLVGDGRRATGVNNSDTVSFNGVQLGVDVFNASLGNYWDSPTFDVSSLVQPNVSKVTTTIPYVDDSLSIGAVVFSTTVQDTDKDGLLDIWETAGFTDMDGTFINLPAMGASPTVKDLFVEVDWLYAAGHSHQPKQAAIDAVIAAFANAPEKINLHIDVGQGGLYTGGNGIPEPATTPPATYWKYTPNGFGAIKNANFSLSRRHVFHYFLWAHQRPNKPNGAANSASGVADVLGTDGMITFGLWKHRNSADNMVGTVQEQTGTFLHELGHNLGLLHGGADSLNCKPNYQSVMNYMFQTHGLQLQNGQIVYDYSRQTLPVLTEASLNEPAGLGSMLYRTRYYVNNPFGTVLTCDGRTGSVKMTRIDTQFSSGAIDWNNNGLPTDASATADIDNNGAIDPSLIGSQDWPALDLQQTSAGYAFSEGEIANESGEIANGEIANGEIANGEIANGEYNFELAVSSGAPPPANLTAQIQDKVNILLTWNTVPLSIVSYYNIYRYVSGQDPSAAVLLGQSLTGSFVDTTTLKKLVYVYFVRTVDEYGNVSATSSNTVSISR